MAFLAGATDVYGFVQLRGLYVSFMSGNTTMLGMSLGNGGFAHSGGIAFLIGLFVIGAAAGEVLLNVAGRFRSVAVLIAVSLLLCVPLIILSWTPFALVLAMGVLNAAMSRVGAANVSLTYVTGALVKFGQGAGKWLTGERADLSWLLQAPMWASLLAGSLVVTMLRHVGVTGLGRCPSLDHCWPPAPFGSGPKAQLTMPSSTIEPTKLLNRKWELPYPWLG